MKTTVPGALLFAVALLVSACPTPAGSPGDDEPETPVSEPLGPGLYSFTGDTPPRETAENVVKIPVLPFTLANALKVIEAETEDPAEYAETGTFPLPKNYLLLIDRDTLLQTWTMKGNVTLTIRGLETERLIQLYNGGTSEELPEYNNASLFTITDNASLILGENITLVGSLANSAPLVSVIQGSFAMQDRTKIQNNGAGGVLVRGDRARFTMHGGEISNCTLLDHGTSPGGAGVQIIYGGTFAMKGGVIRNNRFEPMEGIRYFRFNGGGGVCRDSTGGPFIMEGGEITGNYSYKNGGGVYGEFTISGGSIRGNSSGDSNPLYKNIHDIPVTEGDGFVIEGWNEPLQLVLAAEGDTEDAPVSGLEIGGRLEFSARVTGLGTPSQNVNWSILEPHNPYTTVKDGVLVIGPGETAAGLTVRAASALNPTVYDERALTISVYNEPHLWVKFELRSPDRVTELFDALHDYIQSGELDGGNPRGIRVGDYYDLPRLSIASDGVAPAVSGNNTFVDDGTGIFRVVIVGINSFKGINGNTDSHIVFQFRNSVVSRPMNGSNTNEGGYAGSGMRAYLEHNFLPGLIAAGIPEGVFWAPARLVAKGGDDSGTDPINDRLWLPTVFEIFDEIANYRGLVRDDETRENQALLEHAGSLSVRQNLEGTTATYWFASPGKGLQSDFVSYAKNMYGAYIFTQSRATEKLGVIPAFCVN
ncbi:MAG: DUF6273 domain-containing protein [Treponema sp.]|nr:DUF6273 domain-containing protein [Treponema sp.]